ncbi:MAG: TAT-variant-translocated molybdopterin oxidoreductase [Fuerstiella sp.]
MSSKKWYRSLSELENSSEFDEFLHREFPQAAEEFPEGVSRRRWMQLMGASLTLAGAAGCYKEEKLTPLAARPVNRIPGEHQYFNTSVEVAGQPYALRATSNDGRPTKLDGNALHSSSGNGGSNSYIQGSILDLYDPDRLQSPFEKDNGESFLRSWDEVDSAMSALVKQFSADGGAGLGILSEPTTSPTVARLKAALQKKLPKLGWFEYRSTSNSNQLAGAVKAFGQPVRPLFDLTKTKIVATFDCDLLSSGLNAQHYAKTFADRRDPKGEMNRLYSVESEFTTTGTAADHHLSLASSKIGALLLDLEAAIDAGATKPADDASHAEKFFAALADDLKANAGDCVVAVGPGQPADVHAIGFRINSKLGNIGKTMTLVRGDKPVDHADSLKDFAKQAKSGELKAVVILGGNPVYGAPADIDVTSAIKKLEVSAHLTFLPNETTGKCDWMLPMSHILEGWSDTTLADGSYGIGQPLINPLFESRSAIGMLAVLAGESGDLQSLVRTTAGNVSGKLRTEAAWQKAVHNGFADGTAAAAIEPTTAAFEVDAAGDWKAPVEVSNGQIEVLFTSSSTVFDGQFANNGWLQETPHPLTKLTWGNAAVMSPATAKALELVDHQLTKVEVNGGRAVLPVYIQPGQATGTISVALGYGRTQSGIVGGDEKQGVDPVGVDVSSLRTSSSMAFATNATLSPLQSEEKLASTQDHFAIDKTGMEGIHDRIGDLIREGSLDEYNKHPDFAEHRVHHPPLESLWTEVSYEGHAWGMAIDLNKCIGCNGCVTACQSENNVPIVGKDQVQRNREMHWLRVDRYFGGDDPEQPEVFSQPVTCMQCENAPCEQVCPVAATVHSDEGLNDMVYNRCIGTRYCGNNCPYKVRRFNFLNYRKETKQDNLLQQLVLNPEVTVRSRGVMEKCTYCVQRIQNTKITAKAERRAIGDNEVVTACQEACPSDAISFGDLNNPNSDVAKAHADSRSYGMLSELNVKPRTRYLARIRNHHPWLAKADHDHGHGHSHDEELGSLESNGATVASHDSTNSQEASV